LLSCSVVVCQCALREGGLPFMPGIDPNNPLNLA